MHNSNIRNLEIMVQQPSPANFVSSWHCHTGILYNKTKERVWAYKLFNMNYHTYHYIALQ